MDRTYVLLLPTVRFRCLKFVIGCLEADFAIYFRSKTCNHECIFGCRHTCIYRQTDRETNRPGEAQAEALGPSPAKPARQADRQAGRQTNRQTDSTYITIHYTTFHSIPLRCITLHTWCAPSLGHFFGMRTTFGDIPCPCPDLGGWVWTLSIQHCPSGDRGGGSGIRWQ